MNPPARFRTAFITGCGRSGTTILGTLLSRHPGVRFLNDRFDLWIGPFPFADIWGKGEGEAPGRVVLGEADADRSADARERFVVGLERERRDRPVLVEKLAINNFRLPFHRALCPDALFINLLRHGVEVARSIERRAAAGRWHGRDGRKWAFLAAHARERGLGDLLDRCVGGYEKGLMEWRLSVEAAEPFVAAAPPSRLLRVRYEDLVADPVGTGDRLAAFLGLDPDPAMRAFAAAEVRRRGPAAHGDTIPRSTEDLAGDCLRRHGYRF
jgi:hypothetical protein